MGTRGAMGVTIGGVDKIQYVQFDSYPGGWVDDMVETLRKELPAIRDKAQSLRLVDKDHTASAEEIKTLRKYLDLGVSNQKEDDMYCLLRETQGDLRAALKAGTMVDMRAWLANSLFCEYAYIANFDSGKFEVYEGFQSKPHQRGRFADLPRNEEREYWPVALVAEYPLDAIPEDWADKAFPPDEDE